MLAWKLYYCEVGQFELGKKHERIVCICTVNLNLLVSDNGALWELTNHDFPTNKVTTAHCRLTYIDIMLKRHSYCHWQANHNLLYIRTTGSHRMRQTQMYIHTHIHAYILPVRLYTVQFVLLRTYYTIPCHIPTEQPGWRGVKGIP